MQVTRIGTFSHKIARNMYVINSNYCVSNQARHITTIATIKEKLYTVYCESYILPIWLWNYSLRVFSRKTVASSQISVIILQIIIKFLSLSAIYTTYSYNLWISCTFNEYFSWFPLFNVFIDAPRTGKVVFQFVFQRTSEKVNGWQPPIQRAAIT